MRVLIATTQIPFVRGGAEVLAEGLLNAIRSKGHDAEIVAVPYNCIPPEKILDHMLACRLTDLKEICRVPVDRMIGLKFPAYLMPHPNKVMWILHQHKTAYDHWKHPLSDLIHYPNSLDVRDAIRQADSRLIPEAKAVYTIAKTVSRRLKQYNGIDSEALYPPTQNADKFYCADADDYLFYPSRLSPLKRQELVLEALAQTSQPVRVVFAGSSETPQYLNQLKVIADKLKVQSRVEWLGNINEEEKIRLYARSIGVVFTPDDEDYGYVTIEAMLASKPVITCADSGGPLEFIAHEKTGLIAEPAPESLAAGMDMLWKDRVQARAWGQAANELYKEFDISWDTVVRKLLA